MMTVLTRRPSVSVEDFRRFMIEEYGPVYQRMPQTRGYTQHHLTPTAAGGPDAVVQIAFDSREAMAEALDTDAYRAACVARADFIESIQAGVLDASVMLA